MFLSSSSCKNAAKATIIGDISERFIVTRDERTSLSLQTGEVCPHPWPSVMSGGFLSATIRFETSHNCENIAMNQQGNYRINELCRNASRSCGLCANGIYSNFPPVHISGSDAIASRLVCDRNGLVWTDQTTKHFASDKRWHAPCCRGKWRSRTPLRSSQPQLSLDRSVQPLFSFFFF